MSYETFLSITLTALAVILAAVGIGLGVIAVFGYQSIRAELSAKVREAVDGSVKKAMAECFPEGGLTRLIQEEIFKNVATQVDLMPEAFASVGPPVGKD